MCGLTGFVDFKSSSEEKMESIISSMTSTLIHRGPDDVGIWLDIKSGVALGHRRLSVLDLSKAGHQPMKSLNGKVYYCF